MRILYGIKNCDTVKKARSWLDTQGIDYQFHDYRVDGLSEEKLRQFAAKVGWETLLNRSSTTWRQLKSERQQDITEANALQLMLDHPTLIKRPLFDTGEELIVGFKQDFYQNK